MVLHHSNETLGRAGRPGPEDDSQTLGAKLLGVSGGFFEDIEVRTRPLWREVAARSASKIDSRWIWRGREARHCPTGQCSIQLFGFEVQTFWFQHPRRPIRSCSLVSRLMIVSDLRLSLCYRFSG